MSYIVLCEKCGKFRDQNNEPVCECCMPSLLLAIDPGTTESAWALYDGTLRSFGKGTNEKVLEMVSDASGKVKRLVVEKIMSYGQAVGQEVFETVYWTGRFVQAWHPRPFTRIPRMEVKMHLCHSPRANDSNIRQAIIDLYGGKEVAVGKKATPGPLHGVAGDVWAALGLAITAYNQGVTGHDKHDPSRHGRQAGR